MATRLFRVLSSDSIIAKGQQARYGHTIRGKPPGVARTLKQRLEELNQCDPEISFKVNIGLPHLKARRSEVLGARLAHVKAQRADPHLEKLARNKELIIDLEKAAEDWLETSGPFQIRRVAEHYGVFQDLYGDAYFVPRVPLVIDYKLDQDDTTARVHRGNIIKPDEAGKAPTVTYKSDPDTLWTFLLTSPDGNLTQENSEYCHWFIGNIPGNAVAEGDQLVDYLRPIPTRGTGFHRYIFVLYKQDKRIDFSAYKKEQPCLALRERNWSTYDFYRQHQDYLTPAGLAFFQADWDASLTDFFHNTLQMKEPVFEYDFPKPYIRPQTWFPLRQPFNLYMDKYRDPKTINKEFLMKKLKKVHPFKAPEPPLKFPMGHAYDKKLPSWLKLEMTKERLRWGRINEIEQ